MEPVATSSEDLPGFEAVNLENLSDETLTAEKLESKKNQLWLIKVPYDFDISKLSDTPIILNGTQDLATTNKTDDKRYETRASKYSDKQTSCPFNTLVPSSKKANSLQVAKDFSGHLDIVQTIQVPILEYPSPTPPMYTDIPDGLKARWKPFGHETPPVIFKKSPKKEGNCEPERHKKKHKKERKRSEHVDGEEKTKDKESPKKKKKRKEMKETEGSSTHKRKKKSSHIE